VCWNAGVGEQLAQLGSPVIAQHRHWLQIETAQMRGFCAYLGNCAQPLARHADRRLGVHHTSHYTSLSQIAEMSRS
jgi:hypothetical protein